jgi:hypothetical protein
MSDAQWASTIDLLKVVLPVGFSTFVAVYALWDGRKRDERRSADEMTRATQQRRADLVKMRLDRAWDREFDLIDRVARGVGRYEGLLQYRQRLEVDVTLEGMKRLDELTGGWEEWGAYRAAAHELDPRLAGACIGLGNEVGSLLLKLPEMDPKTRQAQENHAYDLIKDIWPRLAELRTDAERRLSPD